LLDAIHAALERDKEARQQVMLMAELRERYATLTGRERHIMTLVVSGRLNKQIAAELSLSEMTIKVHRGQVMRKMKAESLPELVRMADRLGASSPTA
jgi:FixJ family two-component response regulator